MLHLRNSCSSTVTTTTATATSSSRCNFTQLLINFKLTRFFYLVENMTSTMVPSGQILVDFLNQSMSVPKEALQIFQNTYVNYEEVSVKSNGVMTFK